jgi:excisionase family DNA binding protein
VTERALNVEASRLLEQTQRELEIWLSVRQIAERLGVSRSQVRKWLDNNQFDEVVVFSRRCQRVSEASYQRFVTKYRRKTAW